jgi:hypothetical protein
MAWLAVEPHYRPFFDHPRFQRLLDQLKLTDVAARRWGR